MELNFDFELNLLKTGYNQVELFSEKKLLNGKILIVFQNFKLLQRTFQNILIKGLVTYREKP